MVAAYDPMIARAFSCLRGYVLSGNRRELEGGEGAYENHPREGGVGGAEGGFFCTQHDFVCS